MVSCGVYCNKPQGSNCCCDRHATEVNESTKPIEYEVRSDKNNRSAWSSIEQRSKDRKWRMLTAQSLTRWMNNGWSLSEITVVEWLELVGEEVESRCLVEEERSQSFVCGGGEPTVVRLWRRGENF
ncbi:unnamed protein product [Ilex paraguariensis]|uniref:Uncharacterized protein n=1 Tax=Ilex paraguariensis TaxID=185542 RepID=A0ABC8SYI1_9AQUA